MATENKPHTASSSALAHLDGLLDEALEQTFPASDAVAIDIERESHDRKARVLDSRTPLAGTRKVGERTAQNTNAYPPAPKRVLTAKMQSKLTIALTHAAISPSSAMAHGATIRGEP